MEVFSLLAIATLAIWVTPVTRSHVVAIGGNETRRRALAAALRAGDWFARFRVVGADDRRAV